jgi:hypothetical protein
MIGKILLLINQYTMPYDIKKKPGAKTRFKVVNTKTGYVHAKNTTLTKAQSQLRLLKQLEKKKKI